MGTDLDLYNTYILLYDIYLTCLKGEVGKIRLRAIKKLKENYTLALKKISCRQFDCYLSIIMIANVSLQSNLRRTMEISHPTQIEILRS